MNDRSEPSGTRTGPEPSVNLNNAVVFTQSRFKSYQVVATIFVVASLSLVLLGPIQRASGSASSSAPACRGADLAGAFAYSNLGAGNALITVAISNVGTASCRLGGYPKLMGIRGGHEYKLENVGHGTQDKNLRPAVLSPRMSGALILNTSLGCNANVSPYRGSNNYSGLVVLLPQHRGHVKILGVPLYAPCGLSESQLGWIKGFVFD
jgi:hypothetical protein